jgi:MFS family permease
MIFPGFLTSISRWFEFLTFSILSWELTGNTAVVGYIMTTRFLSLAITGLFFSANGSRFSGQNVMVFFTGICSIFSFLVFISFYIDIQIQLLSLFLISGLSGALWSVDFSFRRRMLGDSLPDYLISSGVSIDVLSTHATRLIGPFVGGLFLAYSKPNFIFLFLSILYFVSTLIILFEKDKNVISNEKKSYLELFSNVIFEVSKNSTLITVIVLTPLFNIFALPFLSLIGILIIEKFSINSFFTGLIVSVEGLGAFIGGVLISAFPPKRKQILFCLTLLLLFLFICLISISKNILLLTILLFLAGIVTSSYSALQSSIIYLYSTPSLRSSTFSLLTIAIGSGSIGTLNISMMSNNFSTQELTLIMGLEGIGFFILVIFFLIMKYKIFRKI